MSESFRTTPPDQPWSSSRARATAIKAPSVRSVRTRNDGLGEAGKIVLVGVLGGLLSAAGYLIYRRLPEEQKQRLNAQVRAMLAAAHHRAASELQYLGRGSACRVRGMRAARGGGGGGSGLSAARSISAIKECDVFWTSRMKRPAWRMTFGQPVRPEKQERETRRRESAPEHPATFGAADFRRSEGLTCGAVQASGPAREDHLHTRQSHRNAGLAGDAAEDPQPVRCAPRLLRSLEPQQTRSRVLFHKERLCRRA